jgi:hypothetical protein
MKKKKEYKAHLIGQYVCEFDSGMILETAFFDCEKRYLVVFIFY